MMIHEITLARLLGEERGGPQPRDTDVPSLGGWLIQVRNARAGLIIIHHYTVGSGALS